jgi:septum site-determining protein MinD
MLAIAGGKGGCGKTTTTLGVGVEHPGATLAVDLDRGMPDLHALASVDREPTMTGRDPLAAAQPAQAVPEGADVDVVPAPPTDADQQEIASALTQLRTANRQVFLDSPAGATEAAALPLRVADRSLLVSTLCAPALRDTAKTAAMARALDAPPVGVVLTRTRLSPGAIEALLDCPVLAAVPRTRPPVLESAVAQAAYKRLAHGIRAGESV